MFQFLRMRVYRRKFIVYLAVLFVLCLLTGILLCSGITAGRVDAFREAALRAFARSEEELGGYVDEIERFVLRVYADQGVLDDMQLFLRADAEEYLSARLDAGTGLAATSFVDSVRDFATTGGRRLFTQISLHGLQHVNVIHFADGGSTISFDVPSTSPLFAQDIRRGIPYTRALVSPLKLTERIGEMRFLMDTDAVFHMMGEYPLRNVALLDTGGNLKALRAGDGFSDAAYRQVLDLGRNQGDARDGLGRIHYVTYTSGRYGYQLVSLITTGALVRESTGLYVFAVVGATMIFLCMALVIALNFRQDARFLGQLIGTIHDAREGHFAQLEVPKTGNAEYGMIAEALSEMGGTLNAYIEREYLLKLKQQETEMVALQQQINPHFLYNTLEILRGRAAKAGDGGLADAIAGLGRLYRYMAKEPAVIPLSRELDMLRAYLDIMAFRYDDAFCYQIQMPESMRGMPTVKFWMQPVAENFFLHGFDPESAFNVLSVEGRERPDAYVIDIINNGAPFEEGELPQLNDALSAGDAGQSGSIGLRNVASRLRYFYGGMCSMQVLAGKAGGVTVRVTIRKEGADAYDPDRR